MPMHPVLGHLTIDWRDHIVSTPGTVGGKPRIKGTRMRVIDVLSYMAAGDTLDDMQEGWPYIARESFQACLLFAAERSIDPVYALAAE